MLLPGILYKLYFLCQVEKQVTFHNIGNKYYDNTKYISMKLHELAPDIKIVWIVSDVHADIPNYVSILKYDRHNYYKSQYASLVFVSNGLDCATHKTWMGKLCKIFLKNKLMICTWHGTPLKKIGMDDIGSNAQITDGVMLLYDYVLAGCNYTARILSRAFQRKQIPIALTGTPRNDIFINNVKENVQHLKLKLNLPLEKKILLFAPTFRDSIEDSGISQMNAFSILQILNACSVRFGGEWIFVFRVHEAVLKAISIAKYESEFVYSGNIGDDMAEYLACADILITDYSSSMFDFALTGRPCFLFAPDREHYEKKERGFYLDYDSLPFPISYTNEELIKSMHEFDDAMYRERVSCFLEEIGNAEDGMASERIARCIVHFVKTGKKNLEMVSCKNNR